MAWRLLGRLYFPSVPEMSACRALGGKVGVAASPSDIQPEAESLGPQACSIFVLGSKIDPPQTLRLPRAAEALP